MFSKRHDILKRVIRTLSLCYVVKFTYSYTHTYVSSFDCIDELNIKSEERPKKNTSINKKFIKITCLKCKTFKLKIFIFFLKKRFKKIKMKRVDFQKFSHFQQQFLGNDAIFYLHKALIKFFQLILFGIFDNIEDFFALSIFLISISETFNRSYWTKFIDVLSTFEKGLSNDIWKNSNILSSQNFWKKSMNFYAFSIGYVKCFNDD